LRAYSRRYSFFFFLQDVEYISYKSHKSQGQVFHRSAAEQSLLCGVPSGWIHSGRQINYEISKHITTRLNGHQSIHVNALRPYPSAILQRYSRWSSRSGTSVKSAGWRKWRMVTLLLMWSCKKDKNKLTYPVWAFPTFAHFDFAKGNGNLFVPPCTDDNFLNWRKVQLLSCSKRWLSEWYAKITCLPQLCWHLWKKCFLWQVPLPSWHLISLSAKWSEAKPTTSVEKRSPCWYVWTDSSIRWGKHDGIFSWTKLAQI
jgi:hypothetical protein